MALLPVVYRAAVPAIESAMRSSPALVQSIATRIGTAANPKAILEAVKNSPVVAGLTLWQIGEIGTSAYQTLVENHPEVGEVLMSLIPPDEIADDFSSTLGRYTDELDLLDDAARTVGGFSNLLRLRQALNLDLKFYKLRAQLSSMGYRR